MYVGANVITLSLNRIIRWCFRLQYTLEMCATDVLQMCYRCACARSIYPQMSTIATYAVARVVDVCQCVGLGNNQV